MWKFILSNLNPTRAAVAPVEMEGSENSDFSSSNSAMSGSGGGNQGLPANGVPNLVENVVVVQPFNSAQRVQHFRNFFLDESLNNERAPVANTRNPSPEMILDKFPPNTVPYRDARRAVEEQYALEVTWDTRHCGIQNMTEGQAFELGCLVWTNFCHHHEQPDSMAEHAVYKWRGKFKFTDTEKVDTRGMLVLLPLALAMGPIGYGRNATAGSGKVKFTYIQTKKWSNTFNVNVRQLQDPTRYGLVVPLMRVLAKYGDTGGYIDSWEHEFETTSGFGWLKAQIVKARDGVHSYEYLEPFCRVEHPHYSTDETVCRERVKGINFRVGIVLRWLCPTFPLPTELTRAGDNCVGSIRLTDAQWRDY